MIDWRGEPILLCGPGLLLDTLDDSDAKEVLGWVNNPEIVSNFQFFTGRVGIEEERLYIDKMNDSPTDLLLGLFVSGVGLIGTCGLHEIDSNNDTKGSWGRTPQNYSNRDEEA